MKKVKTEKEIEIDKKQIKISHENFKIAMRGEFAIRVYPENAYITQTEISEIEKKLKCSLVSVSFDINGIYGLFVKKNN